MSAEHTPGPWKVIGTTTVVRDEGPVIGATICEVEDVNAFVQNEERNAANARLIAAAPEMLAMLREAASWCADCNGSGVICIGTRIEDHGLLGQEELADVEPCPECADIRAVIAKAFTK